MPLWLGEAGGALLEKKRVGELHRQHLAPRRAPAKALTTEELTNLVWRFLAPPWISCGVSTSTSMLKARRDLGFDDAGALWVATGSKREFTGVAVPLGWIPYDNIQTGNYDKYHRKYVSGEIKRGWRGILDHLWSRGYLRRNDPELLYLIGRVAH